MKEYEIIREIINLCPGNHTRDTFIEEAELKIERIDREDGSVVFDVMTAAIHQRYTFSEF